VDVVVYLRKKVTKRVVEDIILVKGYNKQTGDYDTEKIG
jgi:type IV secretion system protein VirB11